MAISVPEEVKTLASFHRGLDDEPPASFSWRGRSTSRNDDFDAGALWQRRRWIEYDHAIDDVSGKVHGWLSIYNRRFTWTMVILLPFSASVMQIGGKVLGQQLQEERQKGSGFGFLRISNS